VPSDSSNTYFASLPPARIGQALFAKVKDKQDDVALREYDMRNRRSYQYYYGLDPSGVHATSGVLRGGEQGELAEVRVNHSRSLVQTLLNLISAVKVVWQPVATNSDYSSAGEVELAQNILEYYWQDRQVNTHALRGLEEAIAFAEAFVFTEWDETAGEDFAAVEGQMVRTGDVRLTPLSTWDVLRDSSVKSFHELSWVILRTQRNKYDLAARFPESEKQILSVTSDEPLLTQGGQTRVPKDSDNVTCYYFFHKPTAAVPQGRETIFLDAKCVLQDGPLTYPVWPLHRVFHSELIGTPYAYTPYYEVLGVQELMDSLQTVIASNQTTFGAQAIAAQMGSELEPDQLAGGMRVIYYPPGGKEPTPLQLTKSPPEVFEHLKSLKQDQEQLMGISGVVRGTPEYGDMSGTALALLQAQTVQQSSGLQNNYLRFLESIGGAILELLKKYAKVERRISISGKASRFLQTDSSFTGQSIGQVRKVMVEIGNPMSQTPAGRGEIAKDLIKMQLVKTAEQYEQVLSTGRLEPLTRSLQHELLLVLHENEMLQDGKQPVLSPDDDHQMHAREHRAVLANPEARENPSVIQAYTAHIEEHFQAYFNSDPRRLIMMGQQPPPVLMPPPGAPGAPPRPGGEGGPPQGAPNGPPPPPEGSGGPGGPPDGSAPPPNVTAGTKGLPRMPKNPATGAKFSPPPGPVPAGPSTHE
jgi:hypothetical protein